INKTYLKWQSGRFFLIFFSISNMELPKYIGTVHPEEWLKQVQAYCYLKDIDNEQKILKFCILMIDSNIIIPKEINSFNELMKYNTSLFGQFGFGNQVVYIFSSLNFFSIISIN